MASFTSPESDTKNDASSLAAGPTSDNCAPTTPASLDTGCKVNDDGAGRANGAIANVAGGAVDVEFKNDASSLAAGPTSDNCAPTTPAALDTGCKVNDDGAGRVNGAIADVARGAVDVEFRPGMSLSAIAQLPLKRRAFALTYSPDIDPAWHQVRELIRSVNVPEAGHWGVTAQELLRPRQETAREAKRREKTLKRLLRNGQWTGGLMLLLLETEEAEDLAAAKALAEITTSKAD